MLLSIETTPDPLPIVDDWTMTADGSIAVVRGRDYHVDWQAPDGRWTSSPKMPFDWQRADDARKQALIDSAAKAEQESNEKRAAAQAEASTTSGGARGGSGGRGGGGGGGGGRANPLQIPNVAARPQIADLPDYFPAFERGAVSSDLDGNLWIRTTTMVQGRPVYDIVNRRGELFDRIQLRVPHDRGLRSRRCLHGRERRRRRRTSRTGESEMSSTHSAVRRS